MLRDRVVKLGPALLDRRPLRFSFATYIPSLPPPRSRGLGSICCSVSKAPCGVPSLVTQESSMGQAHTRPGFSGSILLDDSMQHKENASTDKERRAHGLKRLFPHEIEIPGDVTAVLNQLLADAFALHCKPKACLGRAADTCMITACCSRSARNRFSTCPPSCLGMRASYTCK